MRRAEREARDRFVESARSHLGYRSRPGGLSDFGERVGYLGHDIPWSGAFVDVVARDAGIFVPACVHTPSALAEFIYLKRWTFRPHPGDIVFYSFPTTGAWSQPHVGIVTDVSAYVTHGYFKAIEAQVDSGLPRGSKDRDGIYERVRWKYETIGFGKPMRKLRPAKVQKDATGTQILPTSVRLQNIRIGRAHDDIALIQRALVIKAGLFVYEPGVFDGPTQQAYARWQRIIGFAGADASGEPNRPSLERLARETGLFLVEPGT